ncbi:hypothetical protein SRHO_G00232290 [Serrasalmus rhombeus]
MAPRHSTPGTAALRCWPCAKPDQAPLCCPGAETYPERSLSAVPMRRSALLHVPFVPNWPGTLFTSFRFNLAYNCSLSRAMPINRKQERGAKERLTTTRHAMTSMCAGAATGPLMSRTARPKPTNSSGSPDAQGRLPRKVQSIVQSDKPIKASGLE